MRSPALAVCLALGACNAVLGLDSTVRDDRDLDRDGVDDEVDNCPGLPNPLQLDTDCVQGLICETDGARNSLDGDRDGIDDGCDACLLGPPVDEDGDAVADACDPCPVDHQLGSDLDGDGIDDACDRAPTVPQERLLFDGFNGDHVSIVWESSLAWVVGGGRIAAQSAAALTIHQLQIAGDADGTWSIEVGIDLPAAASPGDEIGLSLDLASEPTECTMVFGTKGWMVRLRTQTLDEGGSVEHTGAARLRASIVRGTLMTPAVHCELLGGEFAERPNNTSPGPFVATLYTTDAGAFRYVEIQGRR